MRLYELSSQFAQLQTLLEEHEDDEKLANEILGVFGDTVSALEDKLDNSACVLRHIDAECKALRDEQARLKHRESSLKAGADRLKAAMLDAMEQAGMSRCRGSRWTIYQQRTPPSVVVDEGVTMDARWYIPQPPKLDKASLRDYLKGGGECNGARLESRLTLRIK